MSTTCKGAKGLCVCVCKPTGSDPMSGLLKYADSAHITVESISLGQGQGPKAAALISSAQQSGGWVVLQVRMTHTHTHTCPLFNAPVDPVHVSVYQTHTCPDM